MGELQNPNKYKGEEYNERVKLHREIITNLKRENIIIENRIRNEYNKDALKIFEDSQLKQFDINTSKDSNQVSSSLENNDKNQLISFVAPGTSGDQNQAITGGASDSGGIPSFGNGNFFKTADMYNLRYTT